LVQSAPVAINITDLDGKVRLWNPAAERIFGWTEADVLGHSLPLLAQAGHDEAGQSRSHVPQGRSCHGIPVRCRRKDGTVIEVSVSAAPLRDNAGSIFGVMAILMDLTEQKELENRLRQAQKMEAVGQLAGGVAHDFNNLLTVITGYSEMLLATMKPEEPARELLEQIYKAGERAASLTRQLLAFGRKQTLQVRVLNLNAVIEELGKMLRRLIGEDIDMVLRLDPLLGRVKADPSQIEQILMNLATNARDAMLEGGKLTITTANVEPGKSPSGLPPEIVPGRHVMVTVSDTGCGMDEATKARIFEPFFTTKEIGKGTGLGLATVYGIVRQSGGHIEVDSQPGRGSTFRICLRQLEEAALGVHDWKGPTDTPRGKETVLLVEDEEAVRKAVNHALQLHGYTVLEANSGQEALKLCQDHKGKIDLLVTDVIMPQMNGRQVAERAGSLQENLKVLYISGYTDRVLGDHGILSPGTMYLQEPISLKALARKVRDVLDASASQGAMAGGH
jgi:PAS domain S-box-containing protein